MTIRLRGAIIVALIGLAVGLFAQPTSASEASRDSALIAASPISSAEVSAPDSGAALADTIVCTAKIQNPHNSSHVPGTVNVVATVNCSKPVASISMTVSLYYNGVRADSRSFSKAGSAFLQGNAATTCMPGQFQGTASGTVVFPPGYVPSPQSFNIASTPVTITCL